MDFAAELKAKIKVCVKNVFDANIDVTLEHPENLEHGDYSTNAAMALAKSQRKSPLELAKRLVDELKSLDTTFNFDGKPYPTFSSIEIAGTGFINFKLSDVWLKHSASQISSLENNFGKSNIGNGKKVLVEFSNPNPNKPLHIGHARNNFIGSSVCNILKLLGYDVIRTNYANDWGTHIVKAMLMYKKHGGEREPDKKSDHFVGDFYAMYEKENFPKNPHLEEELAEMFKKLEARDPETTVLWKKITGWAYDGWASTYSDQNVEFDLLMYQSHYADSGKAMAKYAVDKGFAEKDPSGAIIARLHDKYGIPDKVLLRSNGTSIYSTQDMELAKDSFENYGLDKRLYVVDVRQSDYFKQLFKIMELFGFEWAKGLHHVAYGAVSLPEGKMSSRTGNVVNSDDVYAKLVELEKEEILGSAKRIDNPDEAAKRVALGAFRYGLLKVDNKQDIVFKYDQVTKFEGNTGPYVMYTYARARSILEKSDLIEGNMDPLVVLNDVKLEKSEEVLIKTLYQFPEVVLKAGEEFAPNHIANYIFDVAQKFNSFYGQVSILATEDDIQRRLRLTLVSASSVVLRNGLTLLGIKPVEKM